jgi:hypothetical protein
MPTYHFADGLALVQRPRAISELTVHQKNEVLRQFRALPLAVLGGGRQPAKTARGSLTASRLRAISSPSRFRSSRRCGGITGSCRRAFEQGRDSGMQPRHAGVTRRLVAGQANAGWVEAHSFDIDAYTTRPLTLRDGLAIAPDQPGVGVVFDWDRLTSWTEWKPRPPPRQANGRRKRC